MLLSTTTGAHIKYYSPKEIVDISAEAGFDALDFGYFGQKGAKYYSADFDTKEFVELRKYAESKGLVFNQAHAPFPSSVIELERNEEIFQNIVRSMKNSAILGVKNIVVHPIQHLTYADPGVPEQLFEMNMDFYNRLKPYCEEYGIKVALENMWQSKNFQGDWRIIHSTCSTPEEFNRYLDNLDPNWFVACLDIGHTQLVHQDAADFIRALGHDRLQALHVHDTDGNRDLHTLPYYGGMGYWDRITQALKDINYQGDLTYEAESFALPLPKELYPAATKFMAEMGRYLIEQCK